MDYDSEIEKEAIDFLIEHKDMIVKALADGADFDCNEIEDLDQAFHETIVDRSYTTEDAAVVIAESHETESDSGLWDGKDASDALIAQAAYSFSNDVWSKLEDLYNEMKERSIEIIGETDNADVPYEERGNLPENLEEIAAQQAFDEFEKENSPAEILPVEKDSPEELSLIRQWLRMNAEAGMRGGYPVGGSYIDARCGSGHSMPEVKDYVDFDREFAHKVPWLSGKYKDVVQARFDELIEKTRPNGEGTEAFSALYQLSSAGCPTSPKRREKYRAAYVHLLMVDKCLTIADIRDIAQALQDRVGGF